MEKKHVRLIWIAIILLLLWQAIYLLDAYMLSIQGALIFAVLLHPLYNHIRKYIKKKSVAALLVIFLIVILVLLPLTFISISLVNQASGLQDVNPEYIDTAENQLAAWGIDVNLEEEGGRVVNNIKQAVFSNFVDLLSRLTDFLLNGFIFFFLLYYLLVSGPSVLHFVNRYLPFDDTKNHKLMQESSHIIKAIFYGSILTAAIQGLLGGIGFAIFGVGKALFWGFVMGILSVLPLVGSWLIWGPAVVYLFVTGDVWQAIGLLLYSVIIIAQSDNLIKPYVTSRLGKVHPVVILLGVFAGLSFFGVIGILSGPIILGLLVLLVQYFHDDKNPVLQKEKRKPRTK